MQHQRAEREHERLHEITAAAAAHDPDEILLLIRNAVMELGRFDRVGLWSMENGILHGAWGTDESGKLRDEHGHRLLLTDLAPEHKRIYAENLPYIFSEGAEVYVPGEGKVSVSKLVTFCAIALRARDELIGVIFVDNLLTGAPLSEDHIRAVLPFIHQVAVAVANARLLSERQRMIERQRRLMEMSAAINASLELDEVLRLLRNAVVEAAGFDRAGVYQVDGDAVYGAWGTDGKGKLRDEHYIVETLSDWPAAVRELASGQQRYYIEELDSTDIREVAPHRTVQHVVVALRAGGKLVGLLSVDNLISGHPIVEENILTLLPFVEQAAVAIRNARLLAELRQAQEALVRSERLRAIGELASGVAHNINNILTAVLGYSELIQDEYEATPTIKQYARIIERAALDGGDIANRMQQFAHKESSTGYARFDLIAVVREAVDFGHPVRQNQATAHGASIQIVCDLAPALPILGVASEIREVMVNLIKNAAEAMPRGGTVTIRCFAAKENAVMEISDVGIGMDEHTRGRIFEPFFTTKGVELGSGLGLSVAWGIIERHHGRIEVRSAPGKGTTFTVRLPLAPIETPLPPAAPDRQLLTGLRVLLVEDEELIVEGLLRMLHSRGVVASRAANAQEALEWLAVNATECDLVLSDHSMGGLTGIELLALVRERYPHLRRVLLSGWGANLPYGVDTSVAEHILVKPIRLNDVVAALAKLHSHQVEARPEDETNSTTNATIEANITLCAKR